MAQNLFGSLKNKASLLMKMNNRFSERTFDVIGIGNAIVDVLVQTEDAFLINQNLNKGAMALINQIEAERLYKAIEPLKETSGGSAANTLAGLAMLGGRAGFIGRVKNDRLGEIFTSDIRSVGASFQTPMATNGPSTARCIILVTPDAQRTMCTYLGASVQLEPEDLDLSIIQKAKVLYLEGYLWDNDAAKRAFIAAAKKCKESGGEVALSLSDPFCVDRHRESFLELVNGYIDILFANESEITSLYQTSNMNKAIEKIKTNCKITAITLGEKGSIIIEDQNVHKIPAYNLGKVIDTTGAGDLYAGGFLYAYTKELSIINCGNIGSICAGQVVTELGPRSEISLKELVNRNLESMCSK